MASFVHTSFVLIQYYPRWWSIVPISGLVGVVSGPFWLAEFVYIQKLTKLFVQKTLHKGPRQGKLDTKEDEFTPILRRFTDIFFAVFSASVLFGNLPAAFILSSDVDSTAGDNATVVWCGIDFCPLEYSSSSKSSTDTTLLRIFIGVCLFINLCGVSTILFILENDKHFDELIDDNIKESFEMPNNDKNVQV